MLISFPAAVRVMASACLLLLGPAQFASAQAAADKAAPKTLKPVKPIPPEALKDPEAISAPRRESFELTVDQREHFKKYLPKAFVKLTNREPFHMVTIGDSIVDMYMYDDAANDHLQGYSAMFGKELARQFYYTGDLRVIRPTPNKKGKDRPYLGPEITFRSLGRGGKMMLHAMQALTTYANETPADLLIVSFGINDATAGVNLADYTASLKQVIEVAKARGTEVILLGSTVTVEEPPEVSMAMNRKYVDAMKEIADSNGIFFVDLGDLSPLVEVPAGIKEPALIFDEIVKQYRRFFNHGDKVDYVHPRPELHTLLGKRIFQELIDGPVASPWSISKATAVMESPEKIRLSYDVKNLSKEDDLRLAALPLVAGAWRPMEAQPETVIGKGKTLTLTTTYARTPGTPPNRDGLVPTHETTVRLPIFFDGAKVTRIEQVRADLQPCVVIWKLETLFNQENSFQIGGDLVNTTGEPLKATWDATWMGQKKSGQVALDAGGRQSLGFRFDLPDSSEPMRQKDRLKLIVKVGALELDFSRTMEICRNVGLKAPIILTPDSTPENAPSPLRTAEDRPSVVLKADADKESLYLTYEIHGISMEDMPKGPGAFGWNLNLDARSYGQRLSFGSTDSLRLTGMAADGAYPVVTPTPWAFGTGYAAMYQSEQIKSQLSSSPSGIRRFTVILPRNFFYLHEWAIGNGNSQIGINTAIQFYRSPRNGTEGGYPPEQAFSLLTHSLPRDDARALAVLELTPKPTNRWTVNLF